MEPYETEAIDKLFLELSQFTNAKTRNELVLQDQLERITHALEGIVIPEGDDAGVILLPHESPTRFDEDLKRQVYLHENFSPLGDALVSLWRITQE